MTKASTANGRLTRRVGPFLLLTATLGLTSGCAFDNWLVKKENPATAAGGDGLVMRGGGLEKANDKAFAELEEGKALYRDKKYDQAERKFARIANNTKNAIPVAEAARFYEADCQFLQGHYPRAEGTFKKMLQDFRHGQYQEQATKRLFEIANFWLDDTRRYMEAVEEQKEGKRWFVLPASYIHWEREKPLLDEEGRAMQALETVRLHDLNGPMGEKALFYMATVKFFRKDYKDADYYYSQVYENYPNGELAPKAIKQAVICKQICNGGPEYDGRMVQEARKLIDSAARGYPQLQKDQRWLEQQLISIQHQQASADFGTAEFYRRTGAPGSAYFYYELVRRRYPGTEYATKAKERMVALERRLAKDGKRPESGLPIQQPPAPGPQQPATPPSEVGPPPRLLPPTGPGRPGTNQQPEQAPPPRVLPPSLGPTGTEGRR